MNRQSEEQYVSGCIASMIKNKLINLPGYNNQLNMNENEDGSIEFLICRNRRRQN